MGKLRQLLAQRAKTGASRARGSLLPAAQMAITATIAYAIAATVLGHEGPLFAATAALITLGFNREPKIRKVLEVSIGCTLGILIGDLLMLGLGRELWVATLVLFVSILLARFLDSGATFTMQMGLQSVLVVLLPAPDGGPFTRSLDAIVGSICALLVVFLTPKDPRTEPFEALGALIKDMVTACQDAAEAFRTEKSAAAWHGLILLRRNEHRVGTLEKLLPGSTEQATYNPTGRKHREQLDQLAAALPQLDLAVRSQRIILRRAASALDAGVFNARARTELAAYFAALADALALLNSTLVAAKTLKHHSLGLPREEFAALAMRLSPEQFGVDSIEGQSLVLLLRPMLVDLLVATGISRSAAVAYLPNIE